MGVFKEESYAFETIAKKQRQIYSDAADKGYPFDYENPPEEVIRVIDIINDLKAKDKEDPELPFVRNRESWGSGVSLDVVFFWEQDEGYYNGTKYHISFNRSGNLPSKIEGEYDSFISVDAEPYSEKA